MLQYEVLWCILHYKSENSTYGLIWIGIAKLWPPVLSDLKFPVIIQGWLPRATNIAPFNLRIYHLSTEDKISLKYTQKIRILSHSQSKHWHQPECWVTHNLTFMQINLLYVSNIIECGGNLSKLESCCQPLHHHWLQLWCDGFQGAGGKIRLLCQIVYSMLAISLTIEGGHSQSELWCQPWYYLGVTIKVKFGSHSQSDIYAN